MNKFLLYLIISAIIIIAFLFPKNPTQPQITIQNNQNKKTINLWVQYSFPGIDAYFDDFILSYEKTHSNTDVKLNILKGTDNQVYNYITEKILNGNTPDVLLLSLHNYNAFTTENRLLEMTNYIKAYDQDFFIPSSFENGIYRNNYFGIAYYIDPEIMVINQHLLPESHSADPNFKNTTELLNYLYTLNLSLDLSQREIDAFSIPSLISEGQFINSIMQTYDFQTDDENSVLENNETFTLLKKLFDSQKIYDYTRKSSHPFFNDEAVFSLEPLSLIYDKINSNYSFKSKIDVLDISESDLVFSYSLHHYASVYSHTQMQAESFELLDLLFSETEIVNRYRFYNIPIICNNKKSIFINDTQFKNQYIWPYLENAHHYPISNEIVEHKQIIEQLFESSILPSD